jgi:hypothetical protein
MGGLGKYLAAGGQHDGADTRVGVGAGAARQRDRLAHRRLDAAVVGSVVGLGASHQAPSLLHPNGHRRPRSLTGSTSV